MNKVVITGVGCISSIGNNMAEMKESLLLNKTGVDEVSRFNVSTVKSKIAYLIKNFDLETIPSEWLSKLNRFEITELSYLYALKATSEAITNSSIDLSKLNPKRISVCVGASLTGDAMTEEYLNQLYIGNEFPEPELLNHNLKCVQSILSRITNAQGPAFNVATACASSGNSLGIAIDLIKAGQADVVIAGGTDCYARLVHAGFSSLSALDDVALRAFGEKRNGTVLGEGAAMFIVESEEHAKKRGADITVELAGYAISNDAYHVTAPSPDGYGAMSVMENAMKSAGISKDEVDYISGHGTGTPTNDGIEPVAIKNVFNNSLDKIYVNSTKGYHGHTLAAAGAVEAAALIIQMTDGFIAPVTNVNEGETVDSDLNIVVGKVKKSKINVALSNSFGFGGNNACLAFRQYKE